MRGLQQLELTVVYISTGKQLGDELRQSLSLSKEILMVLNLAIDLIGVKRSMIPLHTSTQVDQLESLQNPLGLGSIRLDDES